ncbi:MAG: GNAT family N-acetyltransferase [Calothrix sp. C42_A2020_038]|nr:GNAT family N-acetyltransferase [Calothrix sp. C42_A2020_038]
MHEVVRLETSQVDQAVEVLQAAFSKDPIFNYLLPEHNTDASAMSLLLRVLLASSYPYQHTYTTAGKLQGVAAWMPPDNSGGNALHLLQSGAVTLPFKLRLLNLIKVITWALEMEKLHQRNIQKPHWYLSLLGVVPTSQGQGVGSLLIEPVLRQADSQGLSCYVETSTENAVRFYQKHGFRVTWYGELLKGSPYLWTMER